MSRRRNGSKNTSVTRILTRTHRKQKIVSQENESADISMKAALEKVEVAAAMMNLYGDILYCNEYLLTLAGRKAKDVMGKNWFEIFLPASRQEELCLLYSQNILSGTFPSQSNYEIQTKFGTRPFISWTHSFLRDDKRRITGLFSIGIEINREEIIPEEKKPEETKPPLQTKVSEAVPQNNLQENPFSESFADGAVDDLNTKAKPADTEKSLETSEKQPKDRGGKYLTFLLNQEEFGVGIAEVKEIMGLVPIRPFPKSPAYIKGVINLRGHMVPVIDLRLRFGLEKMDSTPKTCIVILEIHGAVGPVRIGIIVDTVLEVLRIKEDEIDNAPSFGAAVNTEYILGMAKSDGKVKILLNMRQVLGSELFSLPTKLNSLPRPADASPSR